MKLTINLERDADMTDETWVSHCLELDIVSQGPTPQDAIVMIAEAVDMMVKDEIAALEGSGQIENPGWERAFGNIAEEVARHEAPPGEGTVTALAADIVAAGGTLPYPGTVACASATPVNVPHPLLNPQPDDRDLILEIIGDLESDFPRKTAALRRLLERADNYLGWHARDARIGGPE